MPAVFVHGNPETSAIWDLLKPELGRDDVITLSPPGFGAPVPAGFAATRLEYRDWLAGELEAIGEPVDLVGHDWGGGHVGALALSRPDLLRSWAIDVAGLYHPDYVWHDMAQVWQSDAGEQAVAQMMGAPLSDRVAFYMSVGMPESVAKQVAQWSNEDMASCVLKLYRDAAQPAMREAGKDLSVMRQRPGLVIIAELDTYVGTQEMARDSASRAGASVVVLPEVGHWWMLQNPELGAKVLTDFWASVQSADD